jgi:rRNA-processing protein FCF1
MVLVIVRRMRIKLELIQFQTYQVCITICVSYELTNVVVAEKKNGSCSKINYYSCTTQTVAKDGNNLR